MRKKVLYLLTAIPMILLLAACNMQLPGSQPVSTDSQTAQSDNQGQAFDPANQPIEEKLAMGTLSLEGTDNAVTAEQAKTLLPLWKAVKSLGSSENASEEEINALYTQIEESMTDAQIQAIKDMTLNPNDLQTLLDKLGIQMPQNDGNAPNPGNLSQEELATRQAERQASGQTRGQGGGPGGQGGFAGGGAPGGGAPGGGEMPQGGQMPNDGQMPNVNGTAVPGMARRSGGMNTMLLDPLIQLLEQRASS